MCERRVWLEEIVTTKHNDFIMMASRYGRDSILAEEREESEWVEKSASSAWSFDCMFWWGMEDSLREEEF